MSVITNCSCNWRDRLNLSYFKVDPLLALTVHASIWKKTIKVYACIRNDTVGMCDDFLNSRVYPELPSKVRPIIKAYVQDDNQLVTSCSHIISPPPVKDNAMVNINSWISFWSLSCKASSPIFSPFKAFWFFSPPSSPPLQPFFKKKSLLFLITGLTSILGWNCVTFTAAATKFRACWYTSRSIFPAPLSSDSSSLPEPRA